MPLESDHMGERSLLLESGYLPVREAEATEVQSAQWNLTRKISSNQMSRETATTARQGLSRS